MRKTKMSSEPSEVNGEVDCHSSTQDSNSDSFDSLANTHAAHTEIACVKVQQKVSTHQLPYNLLGEVRVVAAGTSQNYSDKPVQRNIEVTGAQKQYGAAVTNQESLDERLPNDEKPYGTERESMRTVKRKQRSAYEESEGECTEDFTQNLSEENRKLQDQCATYQGKILLLENDCRHHAITREHAEHLNKEIKKQHTEIFLLVRQNDQLRCEKNLQMKKAKNLEENVLRKRREEINALSEEISNLEEAKRALAEEKIELQEKSKNSEENLLREKNEEKNALMEKIRDLEEEIGTQAQEIVELEEKSKNSEENFLREKNALMENIGDFEKERRAKAQERTELHEKYKSLGKTFIRKNEEFKTTMHSKLDSVVAEKNSLTEKIAEFLRQSKNSEENFLREKNALMEKIGDLEEERRAKAQEIAELHEKSKNSEENFLREKNALMEKIRDLEEERRAKAQEIAELHEKSKNSEENFLGEKNALMEKIRDLEEERRAQAQEIAEFHEKSTNSEENFLRENNALMENIRDLEEERRAQEIAEFQEKEEELENVILSLRRKTTNQRKMIDANEIRIDELENQNEQQKADSDAENARVRADVDALNAALATTRAELNASRREADNGQRHNAAMHDLVGQFRRRLQYFAERGQVGHNDLLQIIDDLRFYRPPRGTHGIAVELAEWDDDADGDG